MGHIQINQKIIHHITNIADNGHHPKTFGLGGDFISPAKKPGSAYKPLTAFPNLFILSHLQENAPPPARVSFITFSGLRGLGVISHQTKTNENKTNLSY